MADKKGTGGERSVWEPAPVPGPAPASRGLRLHRVGGGRRRRRRKKEEEDGEEGDEGRVCDARFIIHAINCGSVQALAGVNIEGCRTPFPKLKILD
jgi:hypothetical protein